jgi:hypothetical protein
MLTRIKIAVIRKRAAAQAGPCAAAPVGLEVADIQVLGCALSHTRTTPRRPCCSLDSSRKGDACLLRARPCVEMSSSGGYCTAIAISGTSPHLFSL